MFTVSIKSSPSTSSVEVSRLQDLEQAISFAFQLHNVATSKHYIEACDSDGKAVASFIRQESFVLPNQKDSVAKSQEERKSIFGLKKRS